MILLAYIHLYTFYVNLYCFNIIVIPLILYYFFRISMIKRIIINELGLD